MARRKTQTYGVRDPFPGRGGRLSARHMRSCSEAVAHAICGVFSRHTGPRFRRKCPAAVLCPVGVPLSASTDKRGDSRRLVWTLRSSASSWQGFIVSPGGAPAPPECLVDEPDPRGTAPPPP